MLTLKTYPVPNPTVIGRIVNQEAVLVLPEQGKIKVLNEVGARIWALTDGTRTVDDIVDMITIEYKANRVNVEADALEFISQLAERAIVTLSDQPVSMRP